MLKLASEGVETQAPPDELAAVRTRSTLRRLASLVIIRAAEVALGSRLPPGARALLIAFESGPMFDKILIANRGEIAVRIIRAAHELGVRSVAVYSDADRLAPHVLLADEAYRLGPAPSAESYLRGDLLIEIAMSCGAQAIHPGYGFLAERETFAREVEEAGLVFVGPRSATIGEMGDKTEARRRMQDAGVPIVPGIVEPLEDAAEARTHAAAIGFPVLLKAAAGGGGKGMRVVESEAEIDRAFDAASREATAAFGDGAIYLEKYLDAPRHIEIQLLGDAHGTVVHLGERECSIQRRHQKLIEEAPSPVLTSALRERMGDAAVRAARAVDYLGAGTVEFLVHGQDFYFLEMNTRIQVEHPVTELVTGVDLVEWQLRIAAGERLDFAQEDVRLSGHAIECRITSENPEQGFLPSTGTVDLLELPAGPGVRWDGGVALGSVVGLHYDPLLGKLIVHAATRAGAVERMARALDEFALGGLETSASFHRRAMRSADFRSGDFSIRFMEEHPELLLAAETEEKIEAAAVVAALLEHEERRRRIGGASPASPAPSRSAWQNSIRRP
jgi:acetyl-CoA carboxylase, biotin carboxylase subunit